jgi:hypothetical protein
MQKLVMFVPIFLLANCTTGEIFRLSLAIVNAAQLLVLHDAAMAAAAAATNGFCPMVYAHLEVDTKSICQSFCEIDLHVLIIMHAKACDVATIFLLGSGEFF